MYIYRCNNPSIGRRQRRWEGGKVTRSPSSSSPSPHLRTSASALHHGQLSTSESPWISITGDGVRVAVSSHPQLMICAAHAVMQSRVTCTRGPVFGFTCNENHDQCPVPGTEWLQQTLRMDTSGYKWPRIVPLHLICNTYFYFFFYYNQIDIKRFQINLTSINFVLKRVFTE